MAKSRVKTGDSVLVISGKWKGEEAKILSVISKTDRVVLEISNLSPEKQKQIGRRTLRKTHDTPGGLIDRAISVHVSNVKRKTEEAKDKDVKSSS